MIAIMLLSPQISLLLNTDDSVDQDSRVEPPKRTAYQQLEQFGGSVQVGNQNPLSMTNQFHTVAHQDPFFNDPASLYGKISNPSALALDPMYGFFLEETNTDDHLSLIHI